MSGTQVFSNKCENCPLNLPDYDRDYYVTHKCKYANVEKSAFCCVINTALNSHVLKICILDKYFAFLKRSL